MGLKLTGARVVQVRPMTDDERSVEGWEAVAGDIIVGEYDNGAILYPACPDCGRPGDVWAMYQGQRWKIEPRGELGACSEPPLVRVPLWVTIVAPAALVVATTALLLLAYLLWLH